MTFDEVLAQVQALLQREQRISYRGLKRRFALDDGYLEDLKEELIGAKRLAADEDGRFLIWRGDHETAAVPSRVLTPSPAAPAAAEPQTPDAERRQLTVEFIDLVGSTALSHELDPEELRQVVRAYQQSSAAVIARYDGHIAQYLGDGVLVYFGYPTAHDDDAARAVRAGLEIIEALQQLNPQFTTPLRVRIGIHTGPVVIGEIGGGAKREQLAVGETPNIAARVQSQAEPDTVVMSAATYRLVQGLFECQELGMPTLKGVTTPVALYRIVGESEARSRFDVAVSKGLTPLVGRDEELGLLRRCWEQAQEGTGQVVLLNGEPGIGKSRLVQTLKEQVVAEGSARIEFRCSPYHQNSAFYPIIEHLQRLLQFAPHDAPETKLAKLQQSLTRYHFPQADTLPLLVSLLSLPQPEGVSPLTLSPQRQKQKTQEALVAWVVEEAEKTPVYCAWEDLHWADPSTLEVLTLFLHQVPTTRLLALLTFRPDFTPPWGRHSYLTPLTLPRLGRQQVETMVDKVTAGKALPAEVLQQVVAKTDGVPLFVEELTKMVLESGLVRQTNHHYELTGPLPPLAIPSTLQDSLMARLDRLAAAKELAQLGATLGREFPYDLVQEVSPLDEPSLQQTLAKLVEAEVLYQRGLPPQARYVFKHALIQDAAYQSLLKSTRQHYHQQIAQVLEERFAAVAETQPELVAHHYTEASLPAQALQYWQQAGQRAIARSANVEAVAHLTKGLEVLQKLPDTPERTQQELALYMTLTPPLMATRGYGDPAVEQTLMRTRELCQRIGEPPQRCLVQMGVATFYLVRAEFQTARELSEHCLRLAQDLQDPTLLLGTHMLLGIILLYMGELVSARAHLEQGIAIYDPQQHHFLAFVWGFDPGEHCLSYTSHVLWMLGYPDQALTRSHEALSLAQTLSFPFSVAWALDDAAQLHQFRREEQITQERAEANITLTTEQGFAQVLAWGTMLRGWALVEQGQREIGVTQMHEGLAAIRTTGTEMGRPYALALLAEGYRRVGQIKEGLSIVAEALAVANKTGEQRWEAELYRLKGELTLQPSGQSLESRVKEAEACFHKAIEIARQQGAKSWELRAAVSLSRLWQQQGKTKEAYALLSEIYGWFIEGFDTKDLQEAKALLEELT